VEDRWDATHHVFSSPRSEDLDRLESDPGSVKGQLYDLVCNGVELGSGSIRIHDRAIQERMFKLLGYAADEIDERFGHLLTAFEYGAPPHGGAGLGLDRFVMVLAGEESIREVMAFPKTQTAVDPLFGAPGSVTDEQLAELHLRVVGPERGGGARA
jgi:aspartyl-tRNA synthetase